MGFGRGSDLWAGSGAPEKNTHSFQRPSLPCPAQDCQSPPEGPLLSAFYRPLSGSPLLCLYFSDYLYVYVSSLSLLFSASSLCPQLLPFLRSYACIPNPTQPWVSLGASFSQQTFQVKIYLPAQLWIPPTAPKSSWIP